MRVGVCAVCRARLPASLMDEHHEVPQAAGGRDGPLAALCTQCHTSTHRISTMLMSGKAGLAEDTARIAYPDDAARSRVFALARTVVEHMTLKRDGKLDTGEPCRVVVSLDPHVKLAAQLMANELRGPTGRKLGLARWIQMLVEREVYTKNPQIKKIVARKNQSPL